MLDACVKQAWNPCSVPFTSDGQCSSAFWYTLSSYTYIVPLHRGCQQVPQVFNYPLPDRSGCHSQSIDISSWHVAADLLSCPALQIGQADLALLQAWRSKEAAAGGRQQLYCLQDKGLWTKLRPGGCMGPHTLRLIQHTDSPGPGFQMKTYLWCKRVSCYTKATHITPCQAHACTLAEAKAP